MRGRVGVDPVSGEFIFSLDAVDSVRWYIELSIVVDPVQGFESALAQTAA